MRRSVILGAAMALSLGILSSCGDKSEKTEEAASSSLLQTLSEQALKGINLDEEAPELKAKLEAAGYKVTDYVEFPSQESAINGRMLLYADKGGKKGGLVFLKKPIGNVVNATPAWHWYFNDLAPTAVSKQEFNEDGLWDLRVETKSGETLEMIQDEMFTLEGRNRSGFLAMNGRCSAPSDVNSMMWMSFDGDTLTAWRSSLATEGGAYLEMDTPFGVSDGTLLVRPYSTDQPRTGKVLVDGKVVKTFDFPVGTAEQTIELGEAAVNGRTIRLQFDEVHGGGKVVAIAELEVR